MEVDRKLGTDTLLQHFAENARTHGAVVPPLFQNSLFLFDSVEEFRSAGQDFAGADTYFYSRISNPTLTVVEKKLALLEGTDRCKLVASGMTAIATTFLANVAAGSHIVTVETCYGPVRSLLETTLKDFGVTFTMVEGGCAEEIIDAIRPETTFVYLESPSSMAFRLQDLSAVGKYCRQKGVKTGIDNTYSTPLLQNPAEFGIDYVIHSCTKYIGGHSDVVAGAICGSEADLQALIRKEVANIVSALPPFSAWLLLRGLRTLPLRLNRHRESANQVAGWISDQPWVERVHHVGLPDYPQRSLADRQMRGSGGLFSFEFKDQSQSTSDKFLNALELFGLGVSWGGFESLAVGSEVNSSHLGGPRRMIRLFIGLENPEDLIADISQAAAKAGVS